MTNPFVLRAKDRVVFLGDSITEQRLYTDYVETYLAARYPELELTFSNAGLSGDTAAGGCRRLDSDVLALRPDVVTICYGMNDGGFRPMRPDLRATFATAMRELVTRLKAAGARVVLLTPGMVDATANWYLGAVGYNITALRELADEVLNLASAENLPAADLHRLMNEVDSRAKAAQPSFCMIPDAIHPDPAGHLVMAFGLLQALGIPLRREELLLHPADRAASVTPEIDVPVRRRGRAEGEGIIRQDRHPFFVEPAAQKVLPYLPFQQT